MRIIQRPSVRRGRHRLAAAAAAAAHQHHRPSSPGDQQQPPAAAEQPQPKSAADLHHQPSSPGDQQQPPSSTAAEQPQSKSAADQHLQPSSPGDQHHQPSSPGDQQQPPPAAAAAAEQPQPKSAADQHHQPSSPGDQQQPPPVAAAEQPQPKSAADQHYQPSFPGDHQQPPSVAKTPQLSSTVKQQQPPSSGKQPQPLSEQHQPLSAADQCQPPPAGEQQQQGVLESINNLRAFNRSLTLFLSQFDALNGHPNLISTSIAAASSRDPNKEVSTLVAAPVSELDTNALNDHPDLISSSIAAASSRDPNKEVSTVVAAPVSDLDTSCRRWKSLQEYVTTHLSDVDRLRAEVPAALQRAPNPAQVVLNVIHLGRYYLNPPSAYEGVNNPKVAQRRGCILILECYLSGCSPTRRDLIHGKINSNAIRVAFEWKKRLISEGGIASAGAVDALGLVLFLGSFGVPQKFGNKKLYELLLLSKSEKEAHVLRRSSFLLIKMPAFINYMTSKDMHTEAVDFVFLFGLEEKFDPLSILSCLLHKAKQASEEEVRDEQLSLISVKESNEKYLTVLESVAKCIEVHKLDTSGFDFNIEQRIVMLQTENVEIVQKLKDRSMERNAEEARPLNAPETQPKCPKIVQKLKDKSMKRNAEEARPLNTPETQPKCPRPSATELTLENVKVVSELDTSCRRWKALRRYVTTHLSDVDRLRAEVPAALQRAPDPAQVVLNVIHLGQYYLNPPWAYEGANNPKAAQRRVCILILEFYLSGCFPTRRDLIRRKIDSNAVRVAFEWRKRLISEGGIASADAVDSLGLLLFLGSFGVPEEFSSEDLYELLHLSKSEKEAHVLRQSPFLLEKMHGVIYDMASKDMHVEAVDIVFLFGLEEKFDSLSMLSCLLHKAKQVSEEETRDEQLSLISVKRSNEKYLTVLESVAKCLEVHKLDTSGFDFSIEQSITMLRTKNVEIVQKLKDKNIKSNAIRTMNAEIVQRLKDTNIKRNAEEVGPLYAPGTLPKRPRPSAT